MKHLRDEIVEVDGHPVHVEVRRGTRMPSKAEILGFLILPGPMLATASFEGQQIARIRTELPGCPPLSFQAWAGSYFVALGRQDLKLGHAAFDDRYIVKSGTPDAVHLWLGARELDAILATYDPLAENPFAIAIADGKLELAAAAPSVSRIDEAIAAAALIASRGRRLAAAWCERAAELAGHVQGDRWSCKPDEFAITIPRSTAEIIIDFPTRQTRRGGGLLGTRVWARHLGDATLDEHAAHLAALRTSAAVDWVEVTGSIASAGWDAYVDDVTRLRRACDLVEVLAHPRSVGGGPYR